MRRAVLVVSAMLGAWGCLPEGGGPGDDADEGAEDATVRPPRGDAAPDPDAAPDAAVDRGLRADDGVDRGLEPDADVEPDLGGVCREGQVEGRACGLNARGEETRVCADGGWSPWGCDDPDVCVDDAVEVRACAEGEERRRCEEGHWTPWSACAPPPACMAGDRDARACGLNGRGRETRECADGQWGAWGVCVDPDVCADGDRQEEHCGLNTRGTRSRRCAGGQWGAFEACDDPDVCLDGAVDEQLCGLNDRGGRVSRCEAGQWVVGACEDPDECVDGEARVEPCGLNDRGQRDAVCRFGEWRPMACADPDRCVDDETVIEPCPDEGEGRRVCVEGAYGELHGCSPPPLCPPAGALEVGVPVEGVLAGRSRAFGLCGGLNHAEVTWAFTAPAAGQYVFSAEGSALSTQIYVRSDCDDPLSEIVCSQLQPPWADRLELPLAADEAVVVYLEAHNPQDHAAGGGRYMLVVSIAEGDMAVDDE